MAKPSLKHRYLQLLLLIVGSGVIYPAVYMRQNFEGSMLETFDITRAQLAECHSILGVIFFLTYLPSGWLSDKLPTRWLISVSMAGTGVSHSGSAPPPTMRRSNGFSSAGA